MSARPNAKAGGKKSAQSASGTGVGSQIFAGPKSGGGCSIIERSQPGPAVGRFFCPAGNWRKKPCPGELGGKRPFAARALRTIRQPKAVVEVYRFCDCAACANSGMKCV